jgi:hypothetical protein
MNFANADTLRAIMQIQRPEARSVGSFCSFSFSKFKTKTKEEAQRRSVLEAVRWEETCPVAGRAAGESLLRFKTSLVRQREYESRTEQYW